MRIIAFDHKTPAGCTPIEISAWVGALSTGFSVMKTPLADESSPA